MQTLLLPPGQSPLLRFQPQRKGKVEKQIVVEVHGSVIRPCWLVIISCRELERVSDEEIVEGLADSGVTTVRQPVHTNSAALSFSSAELACRTFVGYLSASVRIFVPDPLRCYHCHRFGHGSSSCREVARCGRCVKSKHSGKWESRESELTLREGIRHGTESVSHVKGRR